MRRMIVCMCKNVRERDIDAAIASGARSFRDVTRCTGCATQCGKCGRDALDLVRSRVASTAASRGDMVTDVMGADQPATR